MPQVILDALTDRLTSLFTTRAVQHGAVIACSAAASATLAIAAARETFSEVSEADSLMNFAKLGTLRCICHHEHPEGLHMDRRQVCRSCGGEVIQADPAMLTRELTSEDIERMTRQLRSAGIKARNLELPSTVTDIHELQAWFKSGAKKTPRNPPTQSSPSVEQQRAS